MREVNRKSRLYLMGESAGAMVGAIAAAFVYGGLFFLGWSLSCAAFNLPKIGFFQCVGIALLLIVSAAMAKHIVKPFFPKRSDEANE